MSDTRVASRYAKSLLGLAVEQGKLEEVHQDMLLLTSICEQNRDFVRILKNPIINHSKKRSILQAIFSDKVDTLTMAIFDIVSRKNREAILPDIARQFHHQYNVTKGIQAASITTTFPLPDKLREEFKQIVKDNFKKEVELKEEVREDLIGGYILKIGDQQIDDSIKSKLKKLKLEFSHNPYIKDF